MAGFRSVAPGQIALQIVTAADPLAADEHLRRGIDAELGLERLHLLAGTQDPLVDREAPLLQQLPGAQAERADMVGQRWGSG